MADKKGSGAADSLPAEKAVPGPPEDKALKKAVEKASEVVEERLAKHKGCPECGGVLEKYSGPSAHKKGREQCANCGYHSGGE